MKAYKRVLLTTVSSSVTTSRRVLQARKTLEKILERLKLCMSSALHTKILVDSQLEIEDASSGSVESTRSAMLEDPLLTRQDPITCPSSGIKVQRPRLLGATATICATSKLSQSHVQNDGDRYRDAETPEKGFRDDSKLERVVPKHDHTALGLFDASEERGLFKDFANVLSWSSGTLPMRHQSEEAAESFDCIDEDRTEDFVDMLCNIPSSVIDTCKAENSDEDTQDSGLCVVITPPDDGWETFYHTAANNRINPQYLGCLIVPPFYQFTSRLATYEEWMSLYHPPARTLSNDQPAATPTRTSPLPLVFNPRRFEKYLQDTKNDRYLCYYIVTALQRYQLKAAAFSASLKASLFRARYDIPGFLENIEPRFKWIDPAEILIESFRHTFQNIVIYTSHRPCSIPHIVIHESPPNDPYVVCSNSSDSQNYCFLSILSPSPSLWDDCLTDSSSSICDTAPVTPKGFSSTLEQDLDVFFSEDTCEIRHSGHEYEDKYVVPQYSRPQPKETISPLQSRFFIPDDDEEDDLPPLDDWYIAIANRCMPPEEAEAVAAAAIPVSCY